MKKDDSIAQELSTFNTGNILDAPLTDSKEFNNLSSQSKLNDTSYYTSENDNEDSVVKTIFTFLLVLIVNLFLPGVGTMILGYFTPRGRSTYIIQGLAQLFLSILFIGWLWALLTSCDMLWKNDSRPRPKKSKGGN